MATSALSNTILDPSGTAVAGARVVARLLPTPGFRTAGGAEIAGQVETDSGSDGAWSLTLERNADITPANTFYEITEYVPVAGRTLRRVWNVSVPASSATLLDALVEPPVNNPPYTIVSGGESGGLAVHEADTTGVHGIADTSALATSSDVSTAVSNHSSDTTSVHGISDTSVLATDSDVSTAVSNHSSDTTSVHGIADTSRLIPAANAFTTAAVEGVGAVSFFDAVSPGERALGLALEGDDNPRVVLRADGGIDFGNGTDSPGIAWLFMDGDTITLGSDAGTELNGGDVEVSSGDVICSGGGVVLYSPNGTPYRIIVDNSGALSTEAQ